MLIAILCDKLNSQEVVIKNSDSAELIFVRIRNDIILGCYYRPQTDKDFTTLSDALESITARFPNDHILLTGDMNLPGIDWNTNTVKCNSQDRQLHEEFLMILELHGLSQIIREPTHCQGNTLDLICSSRPELIGQHSVIAPGLSDHSILTANVIYKFCYIADISKTVKLYNRVDIEKFQTVIQDTKHKLIEMENIDEMWSLFSTSLHQAISDCIPIKEVKMCQDSKPPWFDKDCTKKSRELYNKYRMTGDNFYHEQYKKIRRESKKNLTYI